MEVPRHWRLKKQRLGFTGEECPSCKAPSFYPRVVCPHCGGDTKRELKLGRQEPVLRLGESNQQKMTDVPNRR